MTALNPILYETHVVARDEFGQPIETFGHCAWNGSMAFLVVLASLQFLVLLAAVIEAYKSRSLSTEFAESKHIFQALNGILLVVFVGVPVLIISDDNPNASAFVSSAIVFVASTETLLLIFVPKIKYENERASKQSISERIHITGLDSLGNVVGSRFEASSTEQVPEGGDNSIDGREENEVGERILSTKTRQELITENARLRRIILRMRENGGHDGRLSNESVVPGEIEPLNRNGNNDVAEIHDKDDSDNECKDSCECCTC